MDSKISRNNGKKKALIIAISKYDNLPQEKQLPFCKNNGEAIYEVLQRQGYEIPEDWKLIGTVTNNQLEKAIMDFFRKKAEPKDTLLFYFSGHGIPDGHGGHYLATTDIDTDYPDERGYAFSLLQEKVKMSIAKKIITILDCCFSGAAGITMGNEEDIAKSARSAMDRTFGEGDGKYVLASSLADQVSCKKKDEEYSLFSYYLLEGLKGGGEKGEAVNLEGYVTPYTLGTYVYNGITSEDKRQKPITKTSASGEIILAYYPQLAERQEKELVRTPTELISSSSKSNEELRPLLDSARKFYVRREYRKADIFFERILEIEPNHIEALNSRGIILYRLEEYDGAQSCFDKVLEIDPENIVALNNLETLNNIEILGKKKDDSRQQMKRTAPRYDDGTVPGADPRNRYNDRTPLAPEILSSNDDKDTQIVTTADIADILAEHFRSEFDLKRLCADFEIDEELKKINYQSLEGTNVTEKIFDLLENAKGRGLVKEVIEIACRRNKAPELQDLLNKLKKQEKRARYDTFQT